MGLNGLTWLFVPGLGVPGRSEPMDRAGLRAGERDRTADLMGMERLLGRRNTPGDAMVKLAKVKKGVINYCSIDGLQERNVRKG